jgi:photosystem II stability/assembly factor-like uncharacterized protein
MLRPICFCSWFCSCVLCCALAVLAQAGDNPRPNQEALRFRFLGPQVGNRISAVVGIPGDASTYYAGAASGGVWKSTDGGNRFQAVFDDQPAAAIGALAVAPSDPSTVWAGTGEAWAIRDSDVMGDGVYRSTDAGKTWKHMGLDQTGRIARIVVNPQSADNVFVCALGRLTGPQQERGVYRTTDGGQHWDRVLFADANTGCSGLVMDPHNPHILFAGMWQVEMHTYGEFSGGPGSGVYVSRDSGTTWSRITAHGLPRPPVGKIDVAIAPSNSNRVFALIQTANQGSLWQSDDGGESWRAMSHSRQLTGRAGYYIRLAVSPANENEVLVANSSFHQSLDGGETFRTVPWGGDTHDIWIDPTNADRFVITDDAGMNITTVHGRGLHRVTLPIGQMYHVAVDNQIPYWIYTNMQDNNTMRGPSIGRNAGRNYGGNEENPDAGGGATPSGPEGPGAPSTRTRETTEAAAGNADQQKASTEEPSTEPTGENRTPGTGGGGGLGGNRNGTVGGMPVQAAGDGWDHDLGGCESGFTLPDPTDSDIVWATCYGNEVTRYDAKLKQARSVSPWMHTLDSPPNEAKYRCHWTPPLAIDPFDHNTVYYGCQVIFKTTNAGQSWDVISPDLSTQDPSRLAPSGGIVGDNLGQFYGEVVFSIAPSTIQKGLIWAGTNDGKIWYTKDGGAHWNDVTQNIGMPAWGTVSKIQPSVFDAGTAYIAVDFHLMDDRDPYIYKTTDFGKSWTKITGNLPKGPLAYVRSVAENPNKKGMLFAGTGNGFYYSSDDGANWHALQAGLPHAPVTWIEVQKTFHDVVVSTYGRGIYILDDVTPLEQKEEHATDAQVTLYKPLRAYRIVPGGRAFINFELKSPARVNVAILDAQGKAVREYKNIAAHGGLNRRTWDLRYDPPKLVKLRTDAPGNPFIWDEPRFRHVDSRPITHWGIQPAEVGPVVAPGKFTVKLTVAGRDYTEPLEILRSPKTPATDAQIAESVKLQLRIRDDINRTSDMVNRVEWIRKQTGDVEKMLKAENSQSDLLKTVQGMDEKLKKVEFELISRTDANSDDKYYVDTYKVYLNLIWLNGEVGTGAGDVAGGADYPPTQTSVAVLETIEKSLSGAEADFRALMDKDLPAYNRAMVSGGVTPVTAVLSTHPASPPE